MASKKVPESFKGLVESYIRIMRKYYSGGGDVDFLPAAFEAMKKIREINLQVARVLDNSTFFYLKDYATYKQTYHVIDYLCETNLEQESENEDQQEI